MQASAARTDCRRRLVENRCLKDTDVFIHGWTGLQVGKVGSGKPRRLLYYNRAVSSVGTACNVLCKNTLIGQRRQNFSYTRKVMLKLINEKVKVMKSFGYI